MIEFTENLQETPAPKARIGSNGILGFEANTHGPPRTKELPVSPVVTTGPSNPSSVPIIFPHCTMLCARPTILVTIVVRRSRTNRGHIASNNPYRAAGLHATGTLPTHTPAALLPAALGLLPSGAALVALHPDCTQPAWWRRRGRIVNLLSGRMAAGSRFQRGKAWTD